MNDTVTIRPDDYAVLTRPETVRLERVLPGPIERVWAHLVEPAKRRLWFADGTMDLRIGGEVHLIWRNDTLSRDDAAPPSGYGDANGESFGHGIVTACEPPHRLAFTWAHTGEPETEASFELSARGDRVALVIVHRRLRTDDLIVGVSAGWHAHLAVLAARLDATESPKFWATFARLQKSYRERYGL